MTEKILVGDVVQMAPDCSNVAFAHCFMIVTEVRNWGVIGYFAPIGHFSPIGEINYVPYREEFGKFARIGKAEWMLDNG